MCYWDSLGSILFLWSVVCAFFVSLGQLDLYFFFLFVACLMLQDNKESKLKELDLGHNKIGPDGAKAIAAMLTVPSKPLQLLQPPHYQYCYFLSWCLWWTGSPTSFVSQTKHETKKNTHSHFAHNWPRRQSASDSSVAFCLCGQLCMQYFFFHVSSILGIFVHVWWRVVYYIFEVFSGVIYAGEHFVANTPSGPQ